MKKLWALYSLMAIGLAMSALWLSQGCTGQLPPLAAVVATYTPVGPSNFIGNFESGAWVNPTLAGVLDPQWNAATPAVAQPGPGEDPSGRGLGAWMVDTFGGNPSNTINGGEPKSCNDVNNPCFIQPIPSSMAAGNPSVYAGHVWGQLNSTANAYESHQFRCKFRGSTTNPYYDLSRFSGVQFDIYISSTDTNTAPVFQIAIDKTLPASSGAGGLCTGTGCYNHYQYSLANLSANAQRTPLTTCTGTCRNTWVRVRLPWSAFALSFGSIPGTMADNIKKTIFIQWQFTPNSAAAGVITNTDFWVDNVEFIP